MMDDITAFEKRKKDMKDLWKQTFHDSDSYINLVFDTYYSLENSFARYHENRIIAALLCIPYEFQILTNEGEKRLLRGMYLCGLATHPDWRRRGIMGSLMKEAEDQIKQRGFDLTFLIPADGHLRDYYKRSGYENASWRYSMTLLKDDKGGNETAKATHIYSIKDFFTEGRIDFLSRLACWCREIEVSRQNNTIVHSCKDFLAIMAENENSILLSDSTFNPEFPILAKVIAVAFPVLSEKSSNRLKVVGLYQRSDVREATQKSLHLRADILRPIMNFFKLPTIELILPENQTTDKDRSGQPYAMVKMLNNIGYNEKNDKLRFEISLMLD